MYRRLRSSSGSDSDSSGLGGLRKRSTGKSWKYPSSSSSSSVSISDNSDADSTFHLTESDDESVVIRGGYNFRRTSKRINRKSAQVPVAKRITKKNAQVPVANKRANKKTRVPAAKRVDKNTRVPAAKRVEKNPRVPAAKRVDKNPRVPAAKRVNNKNTRGPAATTVNSARVDYRQINGVPAAIPTRSVPDVVPTRDIPPMITIELDSDSDTDTEIERDTDANIHFEVNSIYYEICQLYNKQPRGDDHCDLYYNMYKQSDAELGQLLPYNDDPDSTVKTKTCRAIRIESTLLFKREILDKDKEDPTFGDGFEMEKMEDPILINEDMFYRVTWRKGIYFGKNVLNAITIYNKWPELALKFYKEYYNETD